MSKKIIDEMIAEILEEQKRLDERSVYIPNKELSKIAKLRKKLKFDKNNQPDTTEKTKAAVKSLRDLDTKQSNKINNDDIAIAKTKGSGAEFDLATWLTTKSDKPTYFKDWANILGTSPSGTYHKDVDKEKLAAVGGTDSDQSELDVGEMPFSQPTMYSKGAESGKFGGAILQSFNTLFGGASTLKERIEILNRASKAAMGIESDIKTQVGEDLHKQLNLAICLDYINAFAKNMDHGAGGYLFEAFVALITSGRVEGKAMGGEDVAMVSTSGEELLNSTKYYSSKESSQAISKFPRNQPVAYVYAYKKDKVDPTTGGTADPDKIVAIDLYVFTVVLDNSGEVTAQGDGFAETKGTEIILNVSNQLPTGTLYLAKSKGESFQDSLESQIKENDTQMKDAYEAMKLYFQETYRANTFAKQYMASQKTADGTSSLQALTSADEQLVTLYNTLRGPDAVTGAGDERKLSKESKLQSLDQLIAETIRDIRKK